MGKTVIKHNYPKKELSKKDYKKLNSLQDESIEYVITLDYSYDIEKNIKTFIRFCNYINSFNLENRLILTEDDINCRTRYVDSINSIYYNLINHLNEFNLLLKSEIDATNSSLKLVYLTFFLEEIEVKNNIINLIQKRSYGSNVTLSELDDLIDNYHNNNLWPNLGGYSYHRINVNVSRSYITIKEKVQKLNFSVAAQPNIISTSINWNLLKLLLIDFFNLKLFESVHITKEEVGILISILKNEHKYKKVSKTTLIFFGSKYRRRLFFLFLNLINQEAKVIPNLQKTYFMNSFSSAFSLRGISISTLEIYISRKNTKNQDYFHLRKYQSKKLEINKQISYNLHTDKLTNRPEYSQTTEYLEYIYRLVNN